MYTQPQGYPPQQQGNPPQGGYPPPQQQGYPQPQQAGNPAPQQGYQGGAGYPPAPPPQVCGNHKFGATVCSYTQGQHGGGGGQGRKSPLQFVIDKLPLNDNFDRRKG